MPSQHLNDTQHTTPHLDGYLKGIRDEFDRLNHELDKTRKQRDEYVTKYGNQVRELLELRQKLSSREDHTASGATDNNSSPLISPVSSSCEYYSTHDGEDATSDSLHSLDNAEEIGHQEKDRSQECTDAGGNEITQEPTVTGSVSLSLESSATPTDKPRYSAWDVEFNNNTKALNLNLVHKLTQNGETCAAFSMDGKYLATASRSGIVSIIDSKTGKRIMHNVMTNQYHEEKSLPEYSCLCFSPDSKYLATGGDDGTVQIWIISQSRVRNMFGHRAAVNALNFSPSGQYLVTCSFDKTVRIWRLRDGSSKVLSTFEVFPWSVRCSLDGRYIASGCNPEGILIWNMRTGKLVTRWNKHSDLVSSLVFTPDGKGLLSGSWDNQVIHWDVTSLGSLGIADRLSSDMTEISRFLGHTAKIYTVSISPDGKWVASASLDKTVRVWSAQEATLHCIFHCPGKVWTVDFSPVGNHLAISGDFGEATIWNYGNP